MTIKEVPGWARKCVFIGILLPMVCFFFIKDYNANAGLVRNVMVQDVEIPFLWGQNPVACVREDIQKILKGSLRMGEPINSYACQRHTLVAYRHVVLLSAFLTLLGIYMFARGNQLANIWPTEWVVFDQKNVRKKEHPQLRMEDPDDHPISPKDGGF